MCSSESRRFTTPVEFHTTSEGGAIENHFGPKQGRLGPRNRPASSYRQQVTRFRRMSTEPSSWCPYFVLVDVYVPPFHVSSRSRSFPPFPRFFAFSRPFSALSRPNYFHGLSINPLSLPFFVCVAIKTNYLTRPFICLFPTMHGIKIFGGRTRGVGGVGKY